MKIKNVLYSQVDDDISSCVQETYLIAWSKIEILKEHKNVAGWLVLTANNVARNFNRLYLTRQDFITYSNELENIIDENEEDFTEKIIGEISAEKILSRLSPDERKLYDLKHVIGLSNENIGKIFGITPNAVASRNKRLIQKLEGFLPLEK